MNIIGTLEGEDGWSFLSVTVDILELVQTTFQTVFIFDASKRHLVYPKPTRRTSNRHQGDPETVTKIVHFDKPGREMLTLLLAVNFGQWAIDVGGAVDIVVLYLTYQKTPKRELSKLCISSDNVYAPC
jgi:Otopetrin